MAKEEKIEEAKRLYQTANADQRYVLESLFPELKESENERIRKTLINGFNKLDKSAVWYNGITNGQILAWLEKQGVQPQGKSALEAINEEKIDNQNCVKPVNNVEPKFKVGDWIIHNKNIKLANSLMLVTGKDNNEYLCKYRDGQCSYNIKFIDKDYHLWTIQDAKDGDILYTSSTASNEIFIFKRLTIEGYIECYCSYDSEDKYCEGKYHFIGKPTFKTHPATKEQCDFLFQIIREKEYEWDAEKKELKKIEQKSAEWSEEDERHLNSIIKRTVAYGDSSIYGLIKDDIDWLKSLKDRVQQQEQMWSIEDEYNQAWIVEMLYGLEDEDKEYEKKCRKMAEWLKSLRPQNNSVTDEELAQAKKDAYNDALDKIEYHSGEPTFDDGWSAAIWYLKKRNAQPQNRWKPSEEMLEALYRAIPENVMEISEDEMLLDKLYQGLKYGRVLSNK